MKKFFEKLLSLIFPSGLSCILCRKELAEANRKCVCEECEAKFPYIVHPCERCGEEVIGEGRFCEACKYVKRDFDKCYSVFNYADKANVLFSASNSLTLANLRFTLLLNPSELNVIGLIANVKYPTNTASSVVKTKYVTD